MTRDVEEYVDILQSTLKVAFLNYKRAHLSVRCPYCGDSVKSEYSAHLNIKVNSEDGVMVWRCVRCEESGIVNSKFTRDIKVLNLDALKLSHKNTTAFNKSGRRIKTTGSSLQPLLIPISRSKESSIKLDYLRDRLNLDISPRDAVSKFKVITDFRKLFERNKWLKITEKERMMKRLNRDGLGFLSSDNSHIIFRDINDEWDKRYFNYKIYNDDILGTSLTYSIASEIDAMEIGLEVSISEGIFDIISISQLNNDNSSAYFASNGKSFKTVINKIRNKGFLDVKPNFYPDDDVNISFFKWLKKEDPILRNKMLSVFYNSIGKDFGVEQSKIKIRKVLI